MTATGKLLTALVAIGVVDTTWHASWSVHHPKMIKMQSRLRKMVHVRWHSVIHLQCSLVRFSSTSSFKRCTTIRKRRRACATLATFGIPVLFWILSTCARFSCYSIAHYDRKTIVSEPHHAHKAIFILQMVYSYSRAMVIGMAGPTDLWVTVLD